jgi:hypothetical protein
MGVDWNRLRLTPPPSRSVWAHSALVHGCIHPDSPVLGDGRSPSCWRSARLSCLRLRLRWRAPRAAGLIPHCCSKGLYLSASTARSTSPAVPGVSAATANHTSAVLDLAVSERWFLIEVVLLLLLAGRPFLRTPTRWATMPVIIGAAPIDVFSTLLAVNKLHFAIY